MTTKPEVTQEALDFAENVKHLGADIDTEALAAEFAKAIQAAEQRGMERAADICAHWAEKYAAASDTAKVAKKRVEMRDFESMGMACRLREHDIRQAIRQGSLAMPRMRRRVAR